MKKTNTSEQEATQEFGTNNKKWNESSRPKTKLVLISVLGLLLLSMVIYLTYSWNQDNELRAKLDQTSNELRANADQANGAISKLSKEVQELKLSYEAAKAESNPSNSVELEGILSAFHLDTTFMSSVGNNVTYGKDQRGYNTAYIEVVVVNKGSDEGFISSGEFKLKDNKDTTYEMYTEQIRNRAELQGKQPLQSQSLAAEERTVGLIAFQVPAEMKEFKLHFKNKVYDVNLR